MHSNINLENHHQRQQCADKAVQQDIKVMNVEDLKVKQAPYVKSSDISQKCVNLNPLSQQITDTKHRSFNNNQEHITFYIPSGKSRKFIIHNSSQIIKPSQSGTTKNRFINSQL